MKAIYKYELNLGESKMYEVTLPRRARVLTIDIKTDQLCLWALVDPDWELEKRRFMVYGTGQEIPYANDLKHINTFQQGPFVWHVFEFMFPAPPV